MYNYFSSLSIDCTPIVHGNDILQLFNKQETMFN